MGNKVLFSEQFEKQLKRLTISEQKRVKKKVDLMRVNVSHPSLRTHRLKGTKGIMESSVNMDLRIIWRWDDRVTILAMDVGHHDILRRYGIF